MGAGLPARARCQPLRLEVRFCRDKRAGTMLLMMPCQMISDRVNQRKVRARVRCAFAETTTDG